MTTKGDSMIMSGTDASGLHLLSTLSHQLELLRRLETRLDGVRDALPIASTGVWRGPAHRAYVSAIEELANAVATVRHDVEHASAATRRAAAKVTAGA